MAKYNLNVVTHFFTKEMQQDLRGMTDEEFRSYLVRRGEDVLFAGDYAAVSIELNGESIRTWGDYYHDKGKEKAEGYIEALQDFLPFDEVMITYEKRADWTD